MARTRHIKQPRSNFIVLTLRSSRFRRQSEISRSIRFNAQIEQRLTIARAVVRVSSQRRDRNSKISKIEIRKLVCLSREFLRRRHPFAAGRSEDRQFFHHERSEER